MSDDKDDDNMEVVSKSRDSKPGIVYLSKIPSLMTVKKIRQVFLQYGDVGRIFLQPDEKAAKKKFGPKQCIFSEGWVEFRDKKVAKRVAFSLNNCQISNKRSSRWFDEIWNIKYLPKFQWGHLNERLAYERAVRKQRLRIEIAQVKKETGFFVQNLEKNKVLKRLEKKQKLNLQSQQREWSFKQKKTDDEIVSQNLSDKANAVPSMKKAQHKVTSAATNTNFLKTLFSGGIQTGKTSVNVDLTS